MYVFYVVLKVWRRTYRGTTGSSGSSYSNRAGLTLWADVEKEAGGEPTHSKVL